MLIELQDRDLTNRQQMEVAIHGPDGATHLILCTGMATLRPTSDASFTFLVGPQLSRRQFVSVIASGAFSKIHVYDTGSAEPGAKLNYEASLLSIAGEYDDGSGRVKVRVVLAPGSSWTELAISYQVGILAELALPCI